VAVAVSEFRFLAGSIARAASERLVLAAEGATAERLPRIAAPASGGTRMQEGTSAFVGMVKISADIAVHKTAGLPIWSPCAIPRPAGSCPPGGLRVT
jgi:acyl-CoA carboxylase subunit beta